MATATPTYSSSGALTITLTGLPTSATLDVGRESTAIDQKDTDDAIDVLVGGKITTGSSPTAARVIEIWCYASYDDTEFSGAATGSDAALTPTEKTTMRLLTIIPTTNTSDRVYKFGPFSIAQAFGGVIPVQWGIWVTHNTGVNLNATASNQEIFRYVIKFESA